MEKWNGEQLNDQRRELLDEFDFHSVMRFCDVMLQHYPDLNFIKYDSVKMIRDEAEGVIDSFIVNHLEDEVISTYSNGKWLVDFSAEDDGVNEALRLSFNYEIESVTPFRFLEKFKENK